MNTRKLIRAISLICSGLLLGAAGGQAYTISDFPAPFVLDGKTQENTVIIVGDKAASSDVIAALDIGLFLQKSARQNQTIELEEEGPLLAGDAVSIGANEAIEINDTIGAIRESLTEVDLKLLKGGQIVTQEGSTEYNQYLKLPTTGESGKVKLKESGGAKAKVGIYLSYQSGTPIFTYELEFEEGIESAIENTHLADLENEDVFILGKPFVIADTYFEPSTDRASITFLSGIAHGMLGENDRETYVVDGKEYDVEVVVISETADDGEGAVKFRINEEITDELEDGETDFLADGTMIGIIDILPSSKNIQKSLVQFYIGAYSIQFTDKNATDDTSNPASTLVNREVIKTSSTAIKGTEIVVNKTFKISKINYTLYTETLTGGASVAQGQTVRAKQKMPEGFLTANWDIAYLGLTQPGSSYIVLDPNGDHSYNLQFTNREGIFYDMPYMTVEGTGGHLKFGDKDDDLWFCEAADTTTYQVTDGDFFVLSNCDGPAQDNTCYSHILRYDSIDTTNFRLTFTDLGTGKREVKFDNATREATIVEAGVPYTAFVDPLKPHNLSIDFNGNGNIVGDCAYIGFMGDGIIALGSNNTNASGAQGPKAFVANNTNNLTITTIVSLFEDADQQENITIKIENRTTGEVIGVPENGIVTPEGGMFGMLTPSGNTQIDLGLTRYGIWIERFDPSGEEDTETITIEYPLEQRTAEVYVTEMPWIEAAEAGQTEKIQPILQPLSKLASEIIDVTKHNAILIGGPCANAITAEIMNNPEPCTKPFIETPGILKLFTHENNNVALLVAGLKGEHTRATSNVLMIYGKEYNTTEAKLSRPTLAEAAIRKT